MSTVKSEKRSHWFTFGDALIVLVVLALLAVAVVTFLFPASEENETATEELTLLVNISDGKAYTEEQLVNQQVFRGDKAVGTITFFDANNGDVAIDLTLETENGAYTLNGEPVRKNGAFLVETKLFSIEGKVLDISKQGGKGSE